jgi:hypothetical protein
MAWDWFRVFCLISGSGCGLTRSSPGGVGHLWGATAFGVTQPARDSRRTPSRLFLIGRAMACRSVEYPHRFLWEVTVGVVVQLHLLLKVCNSSFQFRLGLLNFG